MTNPVPLREGLFRETAAGPTLLASCCTACGHTSYPPAPRCLDCGSEAQEPVELGSEGELLCATVVHMGNNRYPPGYTVGYVTMPHGVRVFAQLAISAGEDLPAPGTPMTLEIVPMWREQEQDVLAYRFVPAPGKESAHA